MREFIQRLPKAELHVHLEGSIEPTTLLEIAPHLSHTEVEARYHYENFAEFLKNFGWVAKHLTAPEHYAIATRRLLQRLEEQNVQYAEITLSAGVILWKNQDPAAVHQAVREATAQSPIRVYWIWDAVRQWGVDRAWQAMELAAARVDDGVVAFGLGGDEANGPARDYAQLFAQARAKGLRLLCHAGEVTNAGSIWQALEIGAERIGHGIRAIDDPALIEHLKAKDIPLEVCVTSNVCTGAVPTLPEHPLRKLFDAGVPLILNTDDPPMFHTTLHEEYALAASQFQFTEPELAQLAANSFRYAFRPL
ncbi:MAG: adenosine deaminase [Acidobacteria bacterium]|nr:adenosine deaminase [Acidobacteriota bacterium]